MRLSLQVSVQATRINKTEMQSVRESPICQCMWNARIPDAGSNFGAFSALASSAFLCPLPFSSERPWILHPQVCTARQRTRSFLLRGHYLLECLKYCWNSSYEILPSPEVSNSSRSCSKNPIKADHRRPDWETTWEMQRARVWER